MIFAKKSLGQNFIIDHNIVSKILNLTDIKNRNVVEIGPGRGALTDKILEKKPKSLILIEKDNKLYLDLLNKYTKHEDIKILNEDVLKCNLEQVLKEKTIIFGNLPYNISSQILIKFIKFKNWPPNFSDLILMFQKEVAEKIIGADYGRLSVISDLRLKFLKKFVVSPNCFIPKPKVESSVLHLKPKRKIKYNIKDLNNLEFITNIFSQVKEKWSIKVLKKF